MFVRIETRPRRVWPWTTALLTGICLAAGLWMQFSPAEAWLHLARRWGTVPSELFQDQALTLWLSEQPLRLITALFMHADAPHLIGNLLFLLLFGIASERVLGGPRFLLLFLACGAVANVIAALSLAASEAPIIGASGAVSAVMGAYVALFPGARLGVVIPLGLYLQFVRVPAMLLLGFWLLLQFLYSLFEPEFAAVAWWAHISGFLSGAVFAQLSRGAVQRRLRA